MHNTPLQGPSESIHLAGVDRLVAPVCACVIGEGVAGGRAGGVCGGRVTGGSSRS